MLQALEIPHVERLHQLLQRFRTEEQSLESVLTDLQTELEHRLGETAFLRCIEPHRVDSLVRRCIELQAECDQLAIELAHVRLAILGVGEELATAERPRPIDSVA